MGQNYIPIEINESIVFLLILILKMISKISRLCLFTHKQNYLVSTIKKNTLKQVPLYSRAFSSIKTIEENFNAANSRINDSLNSFFKKESCDINDVIYTMEKLENDKIGIVDNSNEFRKFITQSDEILRKGASPSLLEVIAKKGNNLNIKDHFFWFSLDNMLKTIDHHSNIGALLPIFSYIIRNKAYASFEFYFRNISDEFTKIILRNLNRLSLHQTIQANYLYAYIGTPIPELTNLLKSSINKPEAVLRDQLSANDIIAASMLSTTLVDVKDRNLNIIVQQLGTAFLDRNINQYDANVEKLDFQIKGKFKHLVTEKLSWESLSYAASVYKSGGIYQNKKVIDRVEELIRMKYENGLVDFESGSLLLATLLNNKEDIDNSTYMEILDMIYWQLAREDIALFSQFDGRNIASFLNSLEILRKMDFNKELLQDFFDYFTNIILSKKIANRRFTQNDYEILSIIYNKTQENFQHPKDIFEFLDKQKQQIR